MATSGAQGVSGTHVAVDDERNRDVLIFVNGELFPRDAAKISVFDSGYLVGDGVWEALRLHDGVLVSLFDVYGADEAFVTGSFGGLVPVVNIDGRVIGTGTPGALTSRLRALYELAVAAYVARAKAHPGA